MRSVVSWQPPPLTCFRVHLSFPASYTLLGESPSQWMSKVVVQGPSTTQNSTVSLCSGAPHWAGRDFVGFASLSVTSPYTILLLPLFLWWVLFSDKPFAHLTVSQHLLPREPIQYSIFLISVNGVNRVAQAQNPESSLILSFPSYYMSNPSASLFSMSSIFLFNLISLYPPSQSLYLSHVGFLFLETIPS